jgi:photosystem II stability/assembly factor-like uncharacterized protein
MSRLAVLAALLAASTSAAPVPETHYQDLHWRLLGPFRAGWATVVAGVPGDPTTFYFGAADGGVWRTTDAGITWRPLFDRGGSSSVGALALAPSDPRVIWIGTGQVHQRWDIADGDGVYRSTDGGATWTHLGLADTRHIGDIWVDPRNADVAIVAALGHVFGPNPERGLFRTQDGGRTWTKVLDRGPEVGGLDVAGDPAHPDLLYASTWQVRRYPWFDYFIPTTGAGSAIYKSTDAGRTWTAAGTTGLPAGPKGRIELGVAAKREGRRVWAAVDAGEEGGVFRSDDGAATWTRVSADTTVTGRYMSYVVPDPQDAEVVWFGGRVIQRSKDGGRTLERIKGAPGGDDYHDLWIDPRDSRRMITGADQGAVVTLNGAVTWSSWYNQPTGQFYRIAADDRFPYRVYSGQQDTGTVSLATRSDYGQLTFRDWHPVGGDERDADIPDPRDPDIVYGAGLGGRLSRYDARTGQVANVAPWPIGSYAARPGTTKYRYPWITPLAVSARPPHAIYLGAQVLFRSTDRGDTWQIVSGDLTGADPAAKDCGGDVPLARATACGYGTIFAIAPSPVADGVVWVGTDNGRVQLTRDDGRTWADVTPPGLGDWTKVNSIDASALDAGTAYVAGDRHRADDFRPIAWRTHDYGKTWTDVSAGLPAGQWLGVVRADPKAPGLLFAGGSRGMHVSFDDGAHWQSLQLDLPRTGINDLVVKNDDVVLATQGRGLWSLDGIAHLRQLAGTAVTAPALLAPADAYRLRANQNKDTPLPPEEPRAPNPPVGALVDYLLPEGGGPVVVEIADEVGNVIRTFRSDDSTTRKHEPLYFTDLWLGPEPRPGTRPGHNRFVWDLRLPPPSTVEADFTIAAVPGRRTPLVPQGLLVLPGRYQVRLTAGGRTLEQPLTVLRDPRVKTSDRELAEQLAFYDEVSAALARSAEIAGRVKEAARLNGRLASLAADLESVDAAPTAAQRAALQELAAQLDAAR